MNLEMNVKQRLICLLAGTWAICILGTSLDDKCNMPEIPEIGRTENFTKDDFLVGSTVKILGGCGPGTYFNRTCLRNNTWSTPSTCHEIKWCEKPALKNHSHIVAQKEAYMFNESITIACDDGYYLHSGHREIWCLPNRTWGVHLPTCLLSKCPENCLSGQICNETDNACPYGKCYSSHWGRQCQHPKECRTTVKGTEYRGYKNVTIGGHVCQMWRNNIPQNHGNKFLDLPENYCRNPDGEPEPWCYTTTKGVRWEICHLPLCGTQCPPPRLSVDTDVINVPANGFDVGYKIKISGTKCGAGLVGSRQCIVKHYRKWSNAECVAVECDEPTLGNDTYIESEKDVYVYGDIITLRCNQGFQMNSSRILQCQNDARWNGTMPICNAIKCKKPHLEMRMQSVSPLLEEYSFNQSINLRCDDGFEIKGKGTITCLTNRTWGIIPECKDNKCSMPELPEFGSIENITQDNFLVGSTVKILGGCGPGTYFNRTCLINNTWSTPSTCHEIKWCEKPALRNHSIAVDSKETYMFNESITIACDDGYYLHSGHSEIWCLPNKTWGVHLPSCLLSKCPENCLSGQICNETDNACPYGKCNDSYWGRQCQHPKECRTTAMGTDYRGYKNFTIGGHVCQMWRSNTPQNHGNKFLDLPENYCRNPDGEPEPWCYTTTKGVRWEICHLPLCGTQCPPPPLSVDTDVINVPANGFDVGYKIKISGTKCGAGLVGSRQCIVKHYRRWSNAECVAVECDQPALGNDTYIESEKDVYVRGDIITVRCNQGFERNGSHIFQCQNDTTWNATMPTCNAIKCKKPHLDLRMQSVSPLQEEYSLYQSINLRCDDGFEIKGKGTITCLANKTWGIIPECKGITCPVPSLPDTHILRITNESKFEVGGQLKVVCREGLFSEDPGYLGCNPDGTWNSSIPHCQNVTCITPSIDNVLIRNTKKMYLYKERLNFTCNDGYLPNTNFVIECQNNGLWNGTVPFCIKTWCANPVLAPHSFLSEPSPKKEKYHFLENIQVSCMPGYILQGEKTFRCQNSGSWNGTMPKCQAIRCSVPRVSQNSTIIIKGEDSFLPGGTIEVGCKEGFTVKGSTKLTCQSNRTWRGARTNCEVTTCKHPANSINNLQVNSRSKIFQYKESVRVTCKDGYSPKGETSIQCGVDGNWSGVMPKCDVVTCRPPSLHNNSYVSNPKVGSYIYMDLIQVSCIPGFEAKGSDKFQCQLNGQWNGTMPYCKAKRCPVPYLTDQYIVISRESDLEIGGSVNIHCSVGMKLIGKNILKCLENGKWNRPLPYCQVIRCSIPSVNENSYIKDTRASYIYGDNIKIVCKIGYKIRGESDFTCQGEGTWNGTMPYCDAIVCALPKLKKENVVVAENFTSISIGSVIQIGCKLGTEPKSFSTLLCMTGGKWNGTLPNCKIIQCSSPSLPNTTHIVSGYKTRYVFGDKIQVKCLSIYEDAEGTKLHCEQSNVWSGSFPVCRDITCKTPDIPNDVQLLVKSSNGFRPGGYIIAECIYGGKNRVLIHCLSGGNWNGSLPNCEDFKCHLPVLSNNSFIEYGKKKTYYIGDTIYLKCREGFRMEGNSLQNCTKSLIWEGAMPVCKTQDPGPVDVPMKPIIIGILSASLAFVLAVVICVVIIITVRKMRKENSKPRVSITWLPKMSREDSAVHSTHGRSSVSFQNPLSFDDSSIQ